MIRTTSAITNEDDFDSAPEMADLELIHRILKRTKHKHSPRRTVSFTSNYINGEVLFHITNDKACYTGLTICCLQNNSPGPIMLNVQIEIDNIRPKIEEIEDDSSSYIEYNL